MSAENLAAPDDVTKRPPPAETPEPSHPAGGGGQPAALERLRQGADSGADAMSDADAGQHTECRLIEMVFPGQTNHYGTLFGGQALALMDKAAFIVASRYARRTVVTASSERCDFHVPVRQGQLIELLARVVATGRSSLTVEVDLFAEDLLTGDRRLGTRGRFVMVALDAHGAPTSVPKLPGAPISEKTDT